MRHMNNLQKISNMLGKTALLVVTASFLLSPITANATFSIPDCAIPTAAGRTIVDLKDRLYADRGLDASIGDKTSVDLPAGNYQVWLWSYDAHSSKVSTQKNEQWKLNLLDSGDNKIVTTAAISDLPEDQDTLLEKSRKQPRRCK